MSDKTIEKENPMTSPTRDEFNTAFNQIHKKLDLNKDHFNEKFEGLAVSVAEIKKEMEMTPAVVIPGRPCDQFREHAADHKKIQFIWIKSIVGAVVAAIVTAIGTAWLFVTKHQP